MSAVWLKSTYNASAGVSITSIINRKAQDAVLHSTNNDLINIMPAREGKLNKGQPGSRGSCSVRGQAARRIAAEQSLVVVSMKRLHAQHFFSRDVHSAWTTQNSHACYSEQPSAWPVLTSLGTVSKQALSIVVLQNIDSSCLGISNRDASFPVAARSLTLGCGRHVDGRTCCYLQARQLNSST